MMKLGRNVRSYGSKGVARIKGEKCVCVWGGGGGGLPFICSWRWSGGCTGEGLVGTHAWGKR